ncbi:aminotransferase class V-fold PLP-dependent enzyme [Flavobacterium sp. P21]|uniref:aminotransferase class V-fold PLP-dependent enzyme n=1 Tax=Flavobacterium sp. P21 TaxID=3423948 RepID=UPI003D670451
MSLQPTIYLDNNATTRIDDRVLDAMIPYFKDLYANPSSGHIAGLHVNEAVENSRMANRKTYWRERRRNHIYFGRNRSN